MNWRHTIIRFLGGTFFLVLSAVTLWGIVSYSPWAPSWNTATAVMQTGNSLRYIFNVWADMVVQWLGWMSLPSAIFLLAWSVGVLRDKPTTFSWRMKLFPLILSIILGVSNMCWGLPSGGLGVMTATLIENIFCGMHLSWWAQTLLTFVALSLMVYLFALHYVGGWLASLWMKWRAHQVQRPVECREEPIQVRRQKKMVTIETEAERPQASHAGPKSVKVLTRLHGSSDLPPLSLLEKSPPFVGGDMTSEQLRDMEAKIVQCMEDFGVKGEVVKVSAGPVVSLFEFVPAPGIKTARIVSLSDDLARAMSAHSVRIASLAGHNALGIEISNKKRTLVTFKPLLEEALAQQDHMSIPIVLGRSITGDPIVVDLAAMPHLLVAGTTGSGKSVGLNVIITSLLYRFTARNCRFIMIDPKVLELSIYEGIPHLLTGVVTRPKDASRALKWLVQEMEDRYQMMAQVGVRNLASFNAVAEKHKKSGEPLTRKMQIGYDSESGEPLYEQQTMSAEALPYIVAIVDEMADLMLSVGKEVEISIQRLAQKARAAGIHVIMATQRPSVDVVTGTIKANFPSRLVFQVSSKIDSRTVIGEQGAEQLMGKGDMLYMESGGKLRRVHGPFLSDNDIHSVVGWLKKHGGPMNLQPIFSEQKSEDFGDNSEGDDLYKQAQEIVIQTQKASTSFLQRKLQIGYNKAASIIEKLEENGIITEADHVGRRRVLRK
ncbi:MAG: DNA translocase FtsK [Alphaproteobacteria bacterium]|nr:DNA translocase FtsK [Alphaproteobacteria bacterium]